MVIAWAILITLLHLSRARPTCKVSVPADLNRGRLLSRSIESHRMDLSDCGLKGHGKHQAPCPCPLECKEPIEGRRARPGI
jgi:hypothetical protein